MKTRYCSKCGKEMIIEENVFIDEYDSKTGLKVSIIKITCPNRQEIYAGLPKHYVDHDAFYIRN